jgi:hypothetical protein
MFQQANKTDNYFREFFTMVTGNSAVAQNEGIMLAQLGELIELDQYADLMGQGTPVARLDLGVALINKVNHPTLGVILLVSTDSGTSALIPLG